MNVPCPECGTVYRIDPARVPDGGVTARCRECGGVFLVEGSQPVAGARPSDREPRGEVTTADVAATPETTSAPAPAFGPQDPETRARRLGRALVSDIKVYNVEKWEASRRQGTLRKEFRDEILKSWDEYVEQVGEDMAKRTPYFRDALNEILADGESVF